MSSYVVVNGKISGDEQTDDPHRWSIGPSSIWTHKFCNLVQSRLRLFDREAFLSGPVEAFSTTVHSSCVIAGLPPDLSVNSVEHGAIEGGLL